ncbi:MAG: M6 family metalloprotease domain-containing protein [Elusimicrobiales bacterium]|nr:M6 family metalloprotease domain-containing protein [Elusimicrobiales bacterium]
MNSTVIHLYDKKIRNFPKSKVKIHKYLSDLKFAPKVKRTNLLNTTGIKKIAIIIVDFPDKKFSFGWHEQAQQIFSQFVNYYEEVSYGKLKLDYIFFYDGGTSSTLTGEELPYTLSRNMGYYGEDTESRLAQLVKDAISMTGTAVNATLYDYVMVFHAGYGNESTNNPQDIWSVYIDWEVPVNGFTDGTIVPEKEYGASPLGVVCHEFAHQLGLPDLYYEQESIVGCWCLMDNGVWLGSPQGSKPSHLSAWCKYFLGWLEPIVISSTVRNIFLENVESSSSAVKIKILTSDNPESEYFLLEYRTQIGFDEGLPGSGLLIWKIDDEIATSPIRLKNNDINSGVPHLAVDLIAADKSLFGKDKNDAGDPFPGAKNVVNFVPQQYNVTAYNGQPINTNITEITLLDEFVNFNIVSISGILAKIMTLDGRYLDNVKVYVYNNSQSTYSFSIKGHCMIELSTGSWNLRCELVNYLDYKDTFIVEEDKLTIKDIVLRYNPALVVKKNEFIIGNNYLDYNKLSKISFRYHVNEPTDVKILVFDLVGNLVKTIERYHSVAGYYEELWDLKEENNQLPAGLYFVCFKSKYNTVIDKFVIKK